MTENCNFSWALHYPNTGVGGSYDTDLGQSGSITEGLGGSGGGSKTFSVNTGGKSTFSVSCSPLASFSGPSGPGTTYHQLSFSFTAAAAFSNVTLQAHSTKDTPGWDPAHPRFFSGTNCSATASGPAVSGYVTHAQLLVGTTVVKDYYDTAFPSHPAAGPNVTLGTNQSTASLSVSFDSTHFADGSVIPIKMVVTDTGGSSYDGTIQATAYNKGYVGYEVAGAIDNGQATATVVDSAITGTNISKTDSSPTDFRAPVITAITANTVFFTYNHGNETPDNINGPNFESPAGVGNTNELIYPDRSSDPKGNGTPPRDDVAEAVAKKSVNVPPYNFVFLDICNGAYTSSFANGFGIPTSGTASGIPAAGATDRAFLGWNGQVEDSDVNTQWTNNLYQGLKAGATLNQAIQVADQTGAGRPYNNDKSSPTYRTGCPNFIFGDGEMTLHGHVYQGTNWFK